MSLPIIYNKNLLANPGFEEGSGSEPDGWQKRSAVWAQDEVRSGQYSFSLIPDSENGWNVFNSRERLPVMQDTTYRLSWWAKLGSDEDSASIGIRETDDDLEWKHFTNQSGWTRYEMEFTPTDPTTKYIQVFGYIGRNNSEPVWYDDFRFEIIED